VLDAARLKHGDARSEPPRGRLRGARVRAGALSKFPSPPAPPRQLLRRLGRGLRPASAWPRAPLTGRFARRSTPDEAAACYAARYPDLRAAFCEKDRCNARQARAHFREFGKREGRKFGCDKGLKPKVLPGWGFEQAYALSCDGPCDVGRAVSLDIVVAAFEHGTAPVVRAVAASLPAHVTPLRAFLYYKKGIDAVDVAHVRAIKRVSSVEAVSLPNVGRCDHAYATHAMRRHNDLADATLFLKDTTPWHVHLGSMVNVLGLTRALPANLEAFCARSPIDETPAFEPV